MDKPHTLTESPTLVYKSNVLRDSVANKMNYARRTSRTAVVEKTINFILLPDNGSRTKFQKHYISLTKQG